jgi:hypothetical protein
MAGYNSPRSALHPIPESPMEAFKPMVLDGTFFLSFILKMVFISGLNTNLWRLALGTSFPVKGSISSNLHPASHTYRLDQSSVSFIKSEPVKEVPSLTIGLEKPILTIVVLPSFLVLRNSFTYLLA